MQELVLDTDTLPKALMERLREPKVRVVKFGEMVTLIPISKDTKRKSKLLGSLSGRNLTIDAFLERKQEEKLLEEEREKRFHAPRLSKEESDAIKKKFAGSSFMELFGSLAEN